MTKTAVVLFNLGGPDGPAAVRPFLFNLFNDPAIIGVPNPFRYLLARWISARRAVIAGQIYDLIGGGSPLLPNTQAQAEALEIFLNDAPTGEQFKCFIAMRYWHPRSVEAAEAVAEYDPDRIVLLPLYPQFSTTTTGSSFDDWEKSARLLGLKAPTASVCCYPTEPGLIRAAAQSIREVLKTVIVGPEAGGPPRLLFSAHGLPKRIVARGDPYCWQIEATAQAIVAALDLPALDWRLCYQSRVGRLEWVGPSTDELLRDAGRDRLPVVIYPIAFTAEHSETLVEIEIEYRHLALQAGVPSFHRVPAAGTAPDYIQGLGDLVKATMGLDSTARICPARFSGCARVNSG